MKKPVKLKGIDIAKAFLAFCKQYTDETKYKVVPCFNMRFCEDWTYLVNKTDEDDIIDNESKAYKEFNKARKKFLKQHQLSDADLITSFIWHRDDRPGIGNVVNDDS